MSKYFHSYIFHNHFEHWTDNSKMGKNIDTNLKSIEFQQDDMYVQGLSQSIASLV